MIPLNPTWLPAGHALGHILAGLQRYLAGDYTSFMGLGVMPEKTTGLAPIFEGVMVL